VEVRIKKMVNNLGCQGVGNAAGDISMSLEVADDGASVHSQVCACNFILKVNDLSR